MAGEGEQREGIENASLGELGDNVAKTVDDAAEAVDNAADSARDAAEPALGLDEDDRLPWLESADDDYDDEGVDTARVFGFVIAGLLALALLVGGIWWFSHRKPDPALIADGSTIPAPSGAYKEAPKDPGGKTFAGTGDTSYSVAAGKKGQAQLSGGGEAPKPSVGASPAAAPSPASGPAAAPATGGIGVQVGAFASKAAAEAGWSALTGKSDALKGVGHRVIEGTADIGKVYRLQAVTGDEAAANALCAKLKAANIACQVKR